jgi:hypothetical protein
MCAYCVNGLHINYVQKKHTWLRVEYLSQEGRRDIHRACRIQQSCSVIGRYLVQHRAHKMGSISSSRQVIHDHDKEEVNIMLSRRLVFGR